MKKLEFAIVGQGLAGTMLAFELLEQGINFKIIGSSKKSKASNVAAGMINPLVFKRLTKSWMLDDLLPVMKSRYQKLEALLETEFFFEKQILKPLSEQEAKLWMEKGKLSEFRNYISEIVTECPVKGIHPMPWYGKVQGAGYVDLKRFLEVSELFFKRKNLFLETEINPSQLTPEKSVFEFGSFSFNKIVFCEGAHIRFNPLFQKIQLKPVKGEVLLIKSNELSEEFILNKKVFVLPVGNQRFKIGSTYEWNDLSELPSEPGKLSIIERFENLLNVEYSIENHWAGIRPTVSDRRPVLGFHPENKNIAVFNGLGTKGVMLTPYFAKEMLMLLTFNNYSVSKEVQVERFL